MKMAFIVHADFMHSKVMELLNAKSIDYYTRWTNVVGKGKGTDPHLGQGTFQSTNDVLMIAFEDEAAIDRIIDGIKELNATVKRADDKVRLFQMPLDRIV